MERRVGASRVAVRFERPARPTDARHGDARDDDDGDGDGRRRRRRRARRSVADASSRDVDETNEDEDARPRWCDARRRMSGTRREA